MFGQLDSLVARAAAMQEVFLQAGREVAGYESALGFGVVGPCLPSTPRPKSSRVDEQNTTSIALGTGACFTQVSTVFRHTAYFSSRRQSKHTGSANSGPVNLRMCNIMFSKSYFR